MTDTKEDKAGDIEAGKSPPLVAGTKPVHQIIWNLMLIIG